MCKDQKEYLTPEVETAVVHFPALVCQSDGNERMSEEDLGDGGFS